MKRIFIAINLPENVKSVLADILAKLQKLYRRAPIRFIKPDGFHITLHFLGNQDDQMIKQISGRLDETAKNFKKTKLVLDGFGFFPNKTRPRVLWIGAREEVEPRRTPQSRWSGMKEGGLTSIINLQKELGGELSKLGIEIDSREWHPHITLGRISGQIDTIILSSMIVPRVQWEASSIDLMESELTPEGAEYKILHRSQLTL